MFLLTRIWDSINDPLMGIIADRTNTKWGKFRPYLLWLAIPLGIIGVLTFTTPELNYQGKIIYAYVTYTLMMMVYTAINIPYSALMGVVSHDPVQRTSFAQYRFIFAFAGAFMVQGLMLPLVNYIGGENSDVITAKYEAQKIVIQEKGIGTSKLFLELQNDTSEAISKNINFTVYAPERKDEIDTTTHIIFLAKRFDTYYLNPEKYFDEPINSKIIKVNIVNEAKGIQGTIAVFAVMAVIFFFITFYTTKERVAPPKEQKANLKDDIKDLVTNVPWIILFLIGLVSLSYVSIRNGAIIYYFKYYIKDELLVTSFLLSGTIVMILAISLTEWLSKKFGKKKVFITLQLFSTIFMVSFFFVDNSNKVLIFILQIIFSFTAGPPAPILFSMYTDCASYSEWKNGRRATGLVMSASTMAQKFGWTIGGALTGWLLAYYGFKANIVQSSETNQGIILMMSLIPAAGSLMAAGLMYFYNLDSQKMDEIEKELMERKGELSS